MSAQLFISNFLVKVQVLKQIGYRFPFEKLMELRRQCFRFLEIIIDRLNCHTAFSDTDGSSEQIIAKYWSNKVIRVKNWWECQRTMLLIPGKDDLPENWKFMQDNQTSCGRIHWRGHYSTAKAVNSDCSFKETIKFSDRLKNIFNFFPNFIPLPSPPSDEINNCRLFYSYYQPRCSQICSSDIF